MNIYPNTNSIPRENVIGTTKQVVWVGIPIIRITEKYDRMNPTSSRQENKGLFKQAHV